VLEAKSLVKRYGNVTALNGADFELYPGEILAVIGDNGAGKSTLIKCISGAEVPDSGTIWLDGEGVLFKNPLEARAAGIEAVYQTSPSHRRWTSPATCSSAANAGGAALPAASCGCSTYGR
jgi:fructose transport system ATP-binding protein